LSNETDLTSRTEALRLFRILKLSQLRYWANQKNVLIVFLLFNYVVTLNMSYNTHKKLNENFGNVPIQTQIDRMLDILK
jgi:hypothetical protein